MPEKGRPGLLAQGDRPKGSVPGNNRGPSPGSENGVVSGESAPLNPLETSVKLNGHLPRVNDTQTFDTNFFFDPVKHGDIPGIGLNA